MVLAFFGFFFACDGGEEMRSEGPELAHVEVQWAVGQVVRISQSEREIPEWVYSNSGIANVARDGDSQKYFYVIGQADSSDQGLAVSAARLKAQGLIAEAFNVTVLQQMAEAFEAIGVDGNEQMDRVRKGLTASKAKATFRGAEQLRVFVDQVAKVTAVNDDEPVLGNAFYMAYCQYGIPYNLYIQQRDGIINDTSRGLRPNSTQRRLLNDAQNALNSLDAQPQYQMTVDRGDVSPEMKNNIRALPPLPYEE
jgi:hypothetical protein